MTLLRGISWFNRLYVAVLAGGGVLFVLDGQFLGGLLLLALAGWMAVQAVRALRGAGTDAFRVETAQPYDERERVVRAQALAVVGMAAILMEAAITVVEVLRSGFAAAQSSLWELVLLGVVPGGAAWGALGGGGLG